MWPVTSWVVFLPQDVGGVLKSLEDALSEVQRVDAKAQSALDLKKQNLNEETKKRKELVKSMEEVSAAACAKTRDTPRIASWSG